MTVRHLDHLNLTVADLDATIDWYARLFGFELVERDLDDEPPWAILRSGEALLCVYEHPDLGPPAAEDRHHLSHFGLRITDRASWERTLEREGTPLLYGGITERRHCTSWYVADPTGHEIEVALWRDDVVRFDPLAA